MTRSALGSSLLFAAMLPASLAGQRVASSEVVWPLPPEPPRIQYLGSVSTEQDIGKEPGLFSRMRNVLAGTTASVVGVQRPHDVVTDGGRIYVSDGARGKLVMFDPDNHTATVLGESGQGYLQKPLGLGGDGQGTIYVADGSGSRVVAFDRDGQFLRAYGGEAEMLNPADVAVDPARDRLYAVDSHLHQVVVFSIASGAVVQRLGREEGSLEEKRQELRGVWEGGIHGARAESDTLPREAEPEGTPTRDLVTNRGSGNGEFRFPAFIAVGPDGTVHVTDQLNFRVQLFGADGTWLRTIGAIGKTPGTFARPKGVAVDGDGNLFVADGAFNNIQIFDTQGQLLLVFSAMGIGEGEIYLPLGMYMDRLTNRLYVADRYNNRVQIFQRLEAPTVTADGITPPGG